MAEEKIPFEPLIKDIPESTLTGLKTLNLPLRESTKEYRLVINTTTPSTLLTVPAGKQFELTYLWISGTNTNAALQSVNFEWLNTAGAFYPFAQVFLPQNAFESISTTFAPATILFKSGESLRIRHTTNTAGSYGIAIIGGNLISNEEVATKLFVV